MKKVFIICALTQFDVTSSKMELLKIDGEYESYELAEERVDALDYGDINFTIIPFYTKS